MLPQGERDAALGAVAAKHQLPSQGPWTVELEWIDKENRLCESPLQPTQVDSVAFSPGLAMFFECKFSETKGGECSQPKLLSKGVNRGLRQCDGDYAPQLNPVNGLSNLCSLTGKGIRYWEFIPNIFDLDSASEYRPCPFAGTNYQWMRTLVLAAAVRPGVKPVGVIVYADSPSLEFPKYINGYDWRKFNDLLKADAAVLHAVSYQELLAEVAPVLKSDAARTWRELQDWVGRKIRTAV